MSSQPWWTTISPDDLQALHGRVRQVMRHKFSDLHAVDIDDAVQHAFVALLRNRQRVVEDNDGLHRYLLTAAGNAVRDKLRRARTRSKTPAADLPLAPESPLPVALAEQRENHAQIREIFCELVELERLIVWSYVVDGRSVRSIAQQLDLSWHRVADTVERVLEKMRRRIEG